MTWGICATLVATLLPLYESSGTILAVFGVKSKDACEAESEESFQDVKKVEMTHNPMGSDDTAHKGREFTV